MLANSRRIFTPWPAPKVRPPLFQRRSRPAERLETERQIESRFFHLRVTLDGAEQVNARRLEIALLLQHMPNVIEAFRILRVDIERLAPSTQRFIRVTQSMTQDAIVVS